MSYKIGKLKIEYIHLIYGIIGVSCIAPLLKDLNSATSIISYIPDMLNILLLILALKNSNMKYFKSCFIFIALLLIFDIIELMIFNQRFLLFLWGARNQYRFIVFFISTVILCNKFDLYKIDLFLRKILLLNFVIVLIELSFGYIQDCLSGTFGISAGSNGSANLFISVCFISLLVDFLFYKIKKSVFLFYVIGIFIWAALAELKYFIILAAVIIVICLFITQYKKINKRAFQIMIISIIIGISSILLLGYARPYYKDFFKLDNLIWYAKHIDMGVGGFGRLTAIPLTNKLFFKNSISKVLFGIGLGSAEVSDMAILDSSFHVVFGSYNYDTLFYAFTYIERGLFGLVWYILFYLQSFKKSIVLKVNDIDDKALLVKSMLCVLLAFLVSFYDDSLRRASGGYIMFFFIAIPYIINSKNSQKER